MAAVNPLLKSSTLACVGNSAVYFGRFKLFSLVPERFQSKFINAGGSTSTSLYSRLPAYDWSTSRLAGLHSTLFDIEANLENGDSRTGLEASGAQEIERLMNTQGVVSNSATRS
jgi:hypothetical protein